MLEDDVPSLKHNASKTICAAAILTIGGCAVSSTQEASSARDPGWPDWLKRALDESERTLEMRCDDFAPLEVVYTEDPAYRACLRESAARVAHARKQVADDALSRCVTEAKAGKHTGCCFSKITDGSFELDSQNSCTSTCERLSGVSAKSNRRCSPQMVSPARPVRSRAHTVTVSAVLAHCRIDQAAVGECDRMPSFVERQYCKNTCDAERSRFQMALKLCTGLATEREIAGVSCNLEEMNAKRECEARCGAIVQANQERTE
jgi:hypothetical protein